MSITQVREKIVKRVNELDEPMLQALHTLLYGQPIDDTDEVIGYDINGLPITKGQFAVQADQILQEVRAGEYVTLEESRKKIKEWLDNID